MVIILENRESPDSVPTESSVPLEYKVKRRAYLKQRYSIFWLRSELLRASIIFLNCASPMQWTWANFQRWWGSGRPGVLLSMGSQRVGRDWAAEQQKLHMIFPQELKAVMKTISIYYFFHWHDLLLFLCSRKLHFKCSLQIVLLLIMWIILVFMKVTDTYL